MVVLHRGKIVYERYFGVLTPEGQHGAMSMTKSVVGTMGAMLVAAGLYALMAAPGLVSDRDLDALLVLFGAAESFVERLPGSRARSFLTLVSSTEVAS